MSRSQLQFEWSRSDLKLRSTDSTPAITSDVLSLEDLGLSQSDYSRFCRLLNEERGLILLAGPEGSGKQSTLDAAEEHLSRRTNSVLTLTEEIPSYEALEQVLQLDPEVIIIPNLGDPETAALAVRAAQTQTLVLATVSVSSADEAIRELLYFGIRPDIIADALNGILVQRLARRLCPECDREEAENFWGLERINLKVRMSGCEACRFRGYQGYIGIFELVSISQTLRQCIVQEGKNADLLAALNQESIHPLQADAFNKFFQKKIALEEVRHIVDKSQSFHA